LDLTKALNTPSIGYAERRRSRYADASISDVVPVMVDRAVVAVGNRPD
jgi:hypothetical protein